LDGGDEDGHEEEGSRRGWRMKKAHIPTATRACRLQLAVEHRRT
jgi:hypothetical protein